MKAITNKYTKTLDERYASDAEAGLTRRHKLLRRVVAPIATVAIAVVGVHGITPKSIQDETVTVQPGEGISDALLRAQQEAAADNPKIDPADTAYIGAADSLEHELEITGQGGYIHPGQEIDVHFSRNGFGRNYVDAVVVPEEQQGK
jgi:hypothetical protein